MVLYLFPNSLPLFLSRKSLTPLSVAWSISIGIFNLISNLQRSLPVSSEELNRKLFSGKTSLTIPGYFVVAIRMASSQVISPSIFGKSLQRTSPPRVVVLFFTGAGNGVGGGFGDVFEKKMTTIGTTIPRIANIMSSFFPTLP